MARIESAVEFWSSSFQNDGFHAYTLSTAASKLLVEEVSESEDGHVNYWKLLGQGLSWQQAFEEAFGLSTEEFYEAFRQFSKSVPEVPMVVFTARASWPESDGAPGGTLNAQVYWLGPNTWSTVTYNNIADPGLTTMYLPEGFVSYAVIRLWWQPVHGPCIYFLGWYKEDGGLTTRRFQATWVEFNGGSFHIDLDLPAHPSTLPPQPCDHCPCPGDG